jgi:stress-induced morphogen
MSMKTDQIEARIRQAYPTCDVKVLDTTGTFDHFHVQVAAKEFAGLPRIRQHQAILDLFRQEFQTGEVHAFEIKTAVKSD